MVTPPVDAQEVVLNIDSSTLKQPAISGSMIINNHTTLLVDIFELVKALNPEWFDAEAKAAASMAEDGWKNHPVCRRFSLFQKPGQTVHGRGRLQGH